MHHDLLRNPDGVSLERVSFKVNANAAGNFKSAAMSEGFAIPTYRNSQELYDGLLQNKVSLASKTFRQMAMASKICCKSITSSCKTVRWQH